jgi:ribosomal protein RSM22 (predicted rRNA methylase)
MTNYFKQFQNFVSQKIDSLKSHQKNQKFLTEIYTTQRSSYSFNADHILTYCVTRCPATYAVIKRCFEELPDDFKPCHVLDLGSGPLTAYFALLDTYENVSYTAVEPHSEMFKIASCIKNHFSFSLSLHQKSIETFLPSANHYDLVIASYVLGEIQDWEKVITLMLQATECFGLIILPGTPLDFSIIKKIRHSILEKGFHILAPCGTEAPCPFPCHVDRWCHFSTHVERSKYHKILKEGTLSYEYEKFSYLLFSKEKVERKKRLLSSPSHHGGHVIVEVCSEQGYKKCIVTKKNKEEYKKVKKLKWGDAIKITF